MSCECKVRSNWRQAGPLFKFELEVANLRFFWSRERRRIDDGDNESIF